MHRIIFFLILSAVIAVGGCARLEMLWDECSRYESRSKSTRYNTQYKAAPKIIDSQNDPRPKLDKPLPKGVVAQIHTYKMVFDGDKISPCSDLSVRKELTIQRANRTDLIFKEIREFYAQDGTLITTNSEDITDQITASGTYQAITPLPIPRGAPSGKYRIVSRFTVESPSWKKPYQLARVEGVFHVVPPASSQ